LSLASVETVTIADQNAVGLVVSITRERNHLARRVHAVDGEQLQVRLT